MTYALKMIGSMLTAAALSFVSASFGGGLPDAHSIYHFKLTKGKGMPVCDAYLQRLNQTNFNDPPYCDRPETNGIPKFDVLERTPISADEAQHLIGSVFDLTHGTRGAKDSLVTPVNGGAPLLIPAMKWPLEMVQGSVHAWRYGGTVDIDNDGMPDNVIVWRGIGASLGTGACGEPMGDGQRQAQIAYVLTGDNSAIDEEKTKAVFGHPLQHYDGIDHSGKPFQIVRFRPIGKSIGIFKFDGSFYFDTFFDIWGDFDNKRREIPKLANTLGVFLRKENKTTEVCEYQMNGTDYPTTPTWSISP